MISSDLPEVIERLARALVAEAHGSPLKPVQWEALRYVARANRFSRTPSALATYLGTTKGTVSQTLQVLESRGLLQKISSPADLRQVRLELTKNGQECLGDNPLSRIEIAAANLDPQDAIIAATALQDILRDILSQRGGLPFGVCRTCRHFKAGEGKDQAHTCTLLKVDLTENDSSKICIEHELRVA